MSSVVLNPLVSELARLPDRLAVLLAGQSEAALCARSRPDDWSAKEIAWHLHAAAGIYHDRLRRTAMEDAPELPAYDEAALARASRYQELDTARLVPELRACREQTVALLVALPPEAWERVAYHAEVGEMTLAQLAAHMVEHEVDHLRGVARLLPGAPTRLMTPTGR
jgi:uncharacterized damage-inducible protein DinB